MAFAIAAGNFGDPTIWDIGVVPSGSEDAYANGFTVNVNGTQSCGRVRNDATTFLLPGMPIPAMTSDTTPSGTVFASTTTVGGEAWRAFDQNTTTQWISSVNSGILGYVFSTGKVIKKYYFRASSAGGIAAPRNFTFQGSMDGITWTDGLSGRPPALDTQTGINVGNSGTFTSPVLLNAIAYTHYRLVVTLTNGSVSSVQISEFEMTEYTGTVNGGLNGGTFNLLNGSNLTTTATTGIIFGSTALTPVITFALPSLNSATLNSSVNEVSSTTGAVLVSFAGTGTLTMIGSYNINGVSTANRRIISMNANGTLEIIGSLTNSANNAANTTNVVQFLSAGTLLVTGNVTGGSNSTSSFNNCTINAQFGGTITVTGNVNASTGQAIGMASGTLNVIGNVTGSSTSNAIGNGTTATTINITGAVTAGTGATAVNGLQLVTVNGLILNNQTWQGVYSPRILIGTSTKAIRYQTPSLVNQLMWSSGVVTIGQPTPNNVRLGTPYGLAPDDFVGTCVIPNANTVLLGVPTDTAIGTLVMSPVAVVEELGTSTLPIAVRLQNVSTVETTGDQIVAYNI
jgi:hypothetical protein